MKLVAALFVSREIAHNSRRKPRVFDSRKVALNAHVGIEVGIVVGKIGDFFVPLRGEPFDEFLRGGKPVGID